MAQTTLTNTVNVQPSGSTAGAVVGFTLDGGTPLTSQSASFVTDDEKAIAGDLHGINQGSQIFSTGGYTEQDLTVHAAPVTVNQANFDTPGLGITSQMLAISLHAQFISANVPNAFIASGSGNAPELFHFKPQQMRRLLTSQVREFMTCAINPGSHWPRTNQ